MSPDNREHEEPESYEVEPPRSIFSAMWFRVLLVVVALGVMAAVAVPYVLEWMSPPPPVARPAPPAAPAPAPAPAVTAAPPPAPATTAPERKEPAPAALVAKPTPPAKSAGKAPARRPAKGVAKAPAATGAYYVQVGAFKDPEHAKKLAVRLREAKFRVEESRGAPGGDRAAAPAPVPAGAGDKYDVFVAGGPVAELSAKLAAKGLATQTSGNGVLVTPSLPLGDAVALSKDLATEGLRVQVRRAGGSAPAAATAAPAREPSAGGDTIHRVRVGPFADRAAAVEALNALKDKGYKDGFIARGGA